MKGEAAMGRVREGSFKYIGEALYARVRYTDEYGIRREKLKKAKTPPRQN